MRNIFGIFLIIASLFYNEAFSKHEVSWIDLPEDDLKIILYKYDEVLTPVNNLIKTYHQISKSSFKKINNRVNLLKNIAESFKKIQETTTDKYIKDVAEVLSTVSIKKANYLQAIKQLKVRKYDAYKKAIFSEELILKGYIPLKLHNIRKFDHKTLEVWGEFFLEAIDPCHRRLMTYFDAWRHDNPSAPIINFFLWLEDKNVPRFIPSILLLDENTLLECEIFIKNNVVCNKEGNPINTIDSKDEYIFIITHDLRILACTAKKLIRHPSLSHYKNILGAGAFAIEKGCIVKLSFESGHYIPQIIHFIQTIKILETKSLILPDDLELIYYENFERILSTIGAFKKKYMQNE